MTFQLIDGKHVAQLMQQHIKQRAEQFTQTFQRAPGLATVLVGDNPASQVYITSKIKACERAGIRSFHQTLPTSTSQDHLIKHLQSLNQDDHVDGILVQLPLPASIKKKIIAQAIDPRKDVDGLHPQNMGLLFYRIPHLMPCTPFGVMKLLEHYKVPLEGKKALVIGRSYIVGRPQALMLLNANATVTIAHRFSTNLPELVADADVVVVAVGKPGLIKGTWFKPGAVVIDVGINRLPDGRLCGDVEFEAAVGRVGMISPVPGGVGPMTIAMLMHNTLQAAFSLKGHTWTDISV